MSNIYTQLQNILEAKIALSILDNIYGDPRCLMQSFTNVYNANYSTLNTFPSIWRQCLQIHNFSWMSRN